MNRGKLSRALVAVFVAAVGCGGETSGSDPHLDDTGGNDGSAGASLAAAAVVHAAVGDPRCPSSWWSLTAGVPVVCATDGLVCTYPDGQAECALDGPTLEWWAIGTYAGCPEFLPAIGATCASAGTSCGYITGRPAAVSSFLTNACCDGDSSRWEIQGSDGCPSGVTCGTIHAADYDQTCAVDSDCVAVFEGNLCDGSCNNCFNAAVNTKAAARYEADFSSKDSKPTNCFCNAGVTVCKAGHCMLG